MVITLFEDILLDIRRYFRYYLYYHASL